MPGPARPALVHGSRGAHPALVQWAFSMDMCSDMVSQRSRPVLVSDRACALQAPGAPAADARCRAMHEIRLMSPLGEPLQMPASPGR